MPLPALKEFQIGWICALLIEVAAAKEMLDENFGILQEQDSADTNTYILGRIGRHHVAIASPGGQYGTTSATTVAINMMRTFPDSIRIGLMVGIGAGIPSAIHDIRLGDIVVSHPEGTCGGVVQYDMGKLVKDGTLRRTGSLNSPPRSIFLTAVSNMRATELTDDPCYPEYIASATKRTIRTRKTFRRPDARTDRLFQVMYRHPPAAATCNECPTEWEIQRDAREEATPQVHYGVIASGNAIMKHGVTRDRLFQDTKALCLDTEAAGLMMDFPCIVIRGIYDYADSHKNEEWQGYTALVAASYTKELLGYVPVGRVSHEKLLSDVCGEMVNEIENVNKGLEKVIALQESLHREQMAWALTQERQACHQAFKTSSYEKYKNDNPDRLDGTCRWVLQNRQYLDWWESGHNNVLWITADPECGKSVLAKSLIDIDFKKSYSPLNICYFFFRDNNEQNDLATELCAILHQLFETSPDLIQHALPSFRSNGLKIQQEVEELWRILIAATSDPASPNIICIFDAIDECKAKDAQQLVRKLEQFYTRTATSLKPRGWLKFLVTSRPYEEIQQSFRPLTASYPRIHLRGEEENDRICEEIRFVMKKLATELAESLELSCETQQRLEKHLSQMEHRTYLWLSLTIDDIHTTFQERLCPEEEPIRLIPPSVAAAYEKILDRVPAAKAETVKIILKLIVGARRPLTIEEMATALGIAMSYGSDIAAQAGLNPEALGKKFRHLCKLFIFIKDSKVYLIHETAKEFLLSCSPESRWYFDQSDVESLMSRVCIHYLLMNDLESDHSQHNLKSRGVLAYASDHWTDHVRNMSLSAYSELTEDVARIYGVTRAQNALRFPVFSNAVINDDRMPGTRAYHLAAFNGHGNMAQRLLAVDRVVIDQSDTVGRSSLFFASETGYIEIVDRGYLFRMTHTRL